MYFYQKNSNQEIEMLALMFVVVLFRLWTLVLLPRRKEILVEHAFTQK